MLFALVCLITVFRYVLKCKIYIDIDTFFLVDDISIKVYIYDSPSSHTKTQICFINRGINFELQRIWNPHIFGNPFATKNREQVAQVACFEIWPIEVSIEEKGNLSVEFEISFFFFFSFFLHTLICFFPPFFITSIHVISEWFSDISPQKICIFCNLSYPKLYE